MDADRGAEDEPAARRPDDVAHQDDDQRRDHQAVEQALDQAQERQLEEEEADVLAEDRIGDGGRPGRREGHLLRPKQHGLPGGAKRAADRHRQEDGEDGQRHAGQRRQVRDVVRLERDRPWLPEPAWTARAAAGTRLRRFVDAIDKAAEAARPLARWRAQPRGQPEVREQDDEGNDETGREQPGLGTQTRPEDAIEADARVPQGIGPQVDAEAEQDDDRDDDADPDTQADPSTGPSAPVIGTARTPPAGRPLVGLARGSTTIDVRGFAIVLRVVVRVGLAGPFIAVVGCVAIVVGRAAVVVGRVAVVVRSPAIVAGIARSLATNLRLAPAELLHEVVEHVAHRGRV